MTVRWTKAHRTVGDARRRASLPDAGLIEVIRDCPDEVQVAVRTFHNDELGGESTFSLALEDVRNHVPGLDVVRSTREATYDVRFRDGHHNLGAPRRPLGTRLELAPGSWCRILHNGRFVGGASTSYQATTLNIANAPRSDKLFLERSPSRTLDHRAHLGT